MKMRLAFRRAPPSNVVPFPVDGTAAEVDRTATRHARILLATILFFTIAAATPISADIKQAAPSCRPTPPALHHGGQRR